MSPTKTNLRLHFRLEWAAHQFRRYTNLLREPASGKYGKPPITRGIWAQLTGVSNSSDVFHGWAKLAISREQFIRELSEEMHQQFPDCKPLPSAEVRLSNLSHARSSSSGNGIELALASSTETSTYRVKSSKPETQRLLSFFAADRQILGDDPRVGKDRGKPAPDIYLVALQSLRAVTDTGTDDHAIQPDECLVFEDSVAGVESGRRAGMRFVWVPHPDVAAEWQSRRKGVLAGRTWTGKLGDEWQLGEIENSWAESIPSLGHFDYEKYGIHVPS